MNIPSIVTSELKEKIHCGDVFANQRKEPKDEKTWKDFAESLHPKLDNQQTFNTKIEKQETDTLMGRLAKRMQARDMIDATNVGVGKKAKNANLADMSIPGKMNMTNAVKIGTSIEKEHTDDKKKAAKIAKDHIKELGPNYYKELPKMEAKLKNSK